MKKIIRGVAYGLLAIAVFLADRFSKAYAFHHFVLPVQVNRFLSAELVFNRGISWGLFRFQDQRCFMGVSFFVILVCVLLALYALARFSKGHSIIGETLVCAGALSNVVDRFVYGGVVDFILLSYNSWSFPVFNIADICIVVGVIIMCLCSADDT